MVGYLCETLLETCTSLIKFSNSHSGSLAGIPALHTMLQCKDCELPMWIFAPEQTLSHARIGDMLRFLETRSRVRMTFCMGLCVLQAPSNRANERMLGKAVGGR